MKEDLIFIQTLTLSLLINLSSSSPMPIMNGEISTDNEFPFAASIGIQAENSTYLHICGGSVIKTCMQDSFSWVISAAHCFTPFQNPKLSVKAGGGNLQNPTTPCAVLEIFMPEFNPFTFQHDIALLKVGCNHQQVVPLAASSVDTEDCKIYGYGSQSPDERTLPSNVLRYGAVRSISFKECEDLLGRAVSPIPGTGQFCARGKAPKYTDACYGDSGSGLICKNMQSNRYELYGLVSFGMSCGTEYSAGVYESLSYYQDWIELTLECKSST